MTVSPSTPRFICSVLKKLLSAAADVHVVDYEAAFDALWLEGLNGGLPQIDEAFIDWQSDKTRVVIVGTDALRRESKTSVKNVVFTQYLTSLSWVAAWRLKYPKSKAHVAVVGTGNPLNGLSARALEMLFRPSEGRSNSIIPGVTWFSAPALYPLLQTLANGGAPLDEAACHILKNTIWAGLAANPNDHHSISNILGAFILREHLEKSKQKEEVATGQLPTPAPSTQEAQTDGPPSPYERHMLALLRALGIQAPERAPEDGTLPWNPAKGEGRTPPQCMLIDDMHQAWNPFLNLALGIRPYIGLSPGQQPGLDKLVNILSAGTKIQQTKHALEKAAPALENLMLFLDLRLFDDATEENSFLKKLHNRAKALTATGSPWPGFSEDELAKMEVSISSRLRGKDEGYLLALTILPRLLAIHFPTLPIVIFSSTAQPIVFKALSPYGNIVTDFQKPSFFSGAMVGDIIETTRRAFVRAVQKARGIQKARAALSSIRLSKTSSHHATRDPQVATIFVDESGNLEKSDQFALGAFIVIGGDYTTADNLSSVLEQNDLVWGFSERNYFPPPDPAASDWAKKVTDQIPATFLEKQADYSEEPETNRRNQSDFGQMVDAKLLEIRNLAGQAQLAKCAAAAFIYDISRFSRPDFATLDFSNIADLDVLYRDGLRDLLRFLFSEWPPIAKPLRDGTLKVRVEVATRELKAKILSSPPYRDELIKKYAAKLRENDRKEWGLITLAGPEVFPLVAGLLADLKLPLRSISGARAVILHDFESVRKAPGRMKVEESLPLQAHYVADWVAKFACRQRPHIPQELLDLFQCGFLQECSESFKALWRNIDRGNSGGRRVESIFSLSSANLVPEHALHSGESAELYLREQANKWQPDLKGAELKSLFERMM